MISLYYIDKARNGQDTFTSIHVQSFLILVNDKHTDTLTVWVMRLNLVLKIRGTIAMLFNLNCYVKETM